jgi:hypothetical protein
MDATSVWRSEIFRKENHKFSFYSGQTIMQKVRGSRSEATKNPEKEDYALRDILLLLQQSLLQLDQTREKTGTVRVRFQSDCK